MPLPVNEPTFWAERLHAALHRGALHEAVYHVDSASWERINQAHKALLARLLPKFRDCTRVLDAGCGYGALQRLLPPGLTYVGVDLSPELVTYGRAWSGADLRVGDLNALPFANREFDLTIARSVDGMVRDNLGFAAWKSMETELLRVSKRLLLLSYTEPTQYVFHGVPAKSGTIRMGDAHLQHRAGMDGTTEVFDLFVPDSHRRCGIATAMLAELANRVEGTVFGFCRVSNQPARALYRKCGFELTTITGFYRSEDAVMFVKPFMERTNDRRARRA